jgi:hypothetical protein
MRTRWIETRHSVVLSCLTRRQRVEPQRRFGVDFEDALGGENPLGEIASCQGIDFSRAAQAGSYPNLSAEGQCAVKRSARNKERSLLCRSDLRSALQPAAAGKLGFHDDYRHD